MSTYYFDMDNLLLCVLITISLQVSFFALMLIFKQFDKITDIALGLNILLLALLTLCLSGSYLPKQLLVTICQSLWALRLGGYLFYRILKIEKDARLDEIRGSYGKMFGLMVAQMIISILVSLPVIFVNSKFAYQFLKMRTFPHVEDVIGFIIWVKGFLIEAIADWQKFTFKTNPENSGKWTTGGLWTYSRHPNYFGDVTLLLGIFIMGIPAYDTYQWVAILPPILTLLLLLLASGLPPLEESLNKRFGENEEFLAYKKTTSPFIPLPPGWYGSLPDPVKKFCFFELPMYAKGLAVPDAPEKPEKPQSAEAAAEEGANGNKDAPEATEETPVAVMAEQ